MPLQTFIYVSPGRGDTQLAAIGKMTLLTRARSSNRFRPVDASASDAGLLPGELYRGVWDRDSALGGGNA